MLLATLLFLLQPTPPAPKPPLTPTTLPAQPAAKAGWSDALAGKWAGTIDLPGGATLGFTLTVTATDAASIAIPEQGLPDSPLTGVAIDTAAMKFKFIIPGAAEANSPAWSLTPAADLATAKGAMTQAGMTLNVSMKKLAAGEDGGPKRPQTPKPPFPYTTREVSYTSFDGAAINGTLTLPPVAHSGTQHPGLPCVLFITGSGMQDRDETLFAHKPFAVLADALARAGIASLRVDDRGWAGALNPAGADATSETFAKDVTAGVDFLLKQPEIDPKRIGLLGHSEGGLIAPAVAAEKPAVAFVVLMAGPGVPGNEVLEVQMGAILRAGGAKPDQIAAALRRQKITLAAIMVGDRDAARQSMRDSIAENAAAAGEPAPEGQALEDAVEGGMKQLDTAWMHYFLARDPRPALRNTRCPVLVLNGGKDAQVVPSQNVPEIVKALLDGGNTSITTCVFPNLNHLFQPCTTGAVAEYGQIETTIDPHVLETITRWCAEIAK